MSYKIERVRWSPYERSRVLVTGPRKWDDPTTVNCALSGILRGGKYVGVLIHGGAQGVDSMAGTWARGLGIEESVFPADWEKHGRSAGPIRNKALLDDGKPDVVIAFRHGYLETRGTNDMIRRSLLAFLPVIIVREEEVI